MFSALCCKRLSFKASKHLFTVVLPIVLLLYDICAAAQETKDVPHISDIRLIRKLGEYDLALGYLKTILANDAITEHVLRQAYNELVTIAYITEGTKSARTTARKAVTEFPDLKVDPNHHPSEIQTIYESLRNTMFGLLQISSHPDHCNVHLDGKEIGFTPLADVYVQPGEHTIQLSNFGYEDEIRNISIEPGSELEQFITMRRHRVICKKGIGLELALSVVSLNYNGNRTTGGLAGIGKIKDSESIPRFGGGIFLHFLRHDKFAFQLGARYICHGNRASYYVNSGLEPVQYNSYYHYLAAPVLLKYYLNQNPRICLCIGPEYGYLIKAELSNVESGESIDILENVQRNQISFIMGASIGMGIRSHHMMISVSHTMGQLSLRKTTNPHDADREPREWKIAFGFILNGRALWQN